LKLQGKVALITGSSRGIGEVIARRLATEGVRVAINYRTSEDAANRVVQSIIGSGGEAFAVGADVSQEQEARSLIERVLEQWQQLDILVNNAGITRDRLLMRMTSDEWDEVLNVNLRGAYLCVKFALPHMVRQRHGRIINISSVVGLAGNAGQANYAASKAGLIGFTKAIAREIASRNITVNALAPGYITTEMVEKLPEEVKKQILARIPLGRFGEPEDVAETVTFLCSDEAGYITGQVITIDGGLTM
jgi:3-oxoacyl-[acyl-carrier protein] reductase